MAKLMETPRSLDHPTDHIGVTTVPNKWCRAAWAVGCRQQLAVEAGSSGYLPMREGAVLYILVKRSAACSLHVETRATPRYPRWDPPPVVHTPVGSPLINHTTCPDAPVPSSRRAGSSGEYIRRVEGGCSSHGDQGRGRGRGQTRRGCGDPKSGCVICCQVPLPTGCVALAPSCSGR